MVLVLDEFLCSCSSRDYLLVIIGSEAAETMTTTS